MSVEKDRNGNWILPNGEMVSDGISRRELSKLHKEYQYKADACRRLAESLRRGWDPTEDREFHFYQDDYQQWRDGDHNVLTEQSYDSPVQVAYENAQEYGAMAAAYKQIASSDERPRNTSSSPEPSRMSSSGKGPYNRFIGTVVPLLFVLVMIIIVAMVLF